MKAFYFVFVLILVNGQLQAQGLIMSRFFKPGIKVGLEYQPQRFMVSDGSMDLGRGTAGISLPIKSKLGVKVDWKNLNLKTLTDFKNWKKLPNNLAKVFQPKMHQIFWNINGSYTYLNAADVLIDLKPPHSTTGNTKLTLYGANTGITGFHYLRKARILFYSANIGIVEDAFSLNKPQPQANLLAGLVQVTGLHSILYVGAYAAYWEKRVIPVPFLGFDTRIKKGIRLNITLPVSAKLTFKQKKNRFVLLAAYQGLLMALGEPRLVEERGAFAISYLKTGLQYNLKMGKQSRLVLDAGLANMRNIREREDDIKEQATTPFSLYAGATLHYNFGKSLFDASLGNLLN